VLNNSGSFDIRSDRTWRHFAGAAGSLTLNNSGTLKKSAGSGDFSFLSTVLNNTGTIAILTGRILVNGTPI
ncbi:MAG: hypothetical protein IT531_19860, partial [Burkholderiales bacterium]|nr:hypothetical protein [Burkholderiales bacterium]